MKVVSAVVKYAAMSCLAVSILANGSVMKVFVVPARSDWTLDVIAERWRKRSFVATRTTK